MVLAVCRRTMECEQNRIGAAFAVYGLLLDIQRRQIEHLERIRTRRRARRTVYRCPALDAPVLHYGVDDGIVENIVALEHDYPDDRRWLHIGRRRCRLRICRNRHSNRFAGKGYGYSVVAPYLRGRPVAPFFVVDAGSREEHDQALRCRQLERDGRGVVVRRLVEGHAVHV